MSALLDLLQGSKSATKTRAPGSGSALARLLSGSGPKQPAPQNPSADLGPIPPGSTKVQLDGGKIGYKTPSGSIIENLPGGLRRVTLAKQFGGGVYTIDMKNPSRLINSGHGNYGGVGKGPPGTERNDVMPVSLGGVNADKNNIQIQTGYTKGGQSSGQADTSDRLEKSLSDAVKSGKMTLQQAQVQAALNNQQESGQVPKQGIMSYLLGSLGDAAKTAGKIALQLPEGLYKPFTSPSPTELALEKNFPTNQGFAGKAASAIVKPITRFFEPFVEQIGQQIGTAIGSGGKVLPNQLDAFLAGGSFGIGAAGSFIGGGEAPKAVSAVGEAAAEAPKPPVLSALESLGKEDIVKPEAVQLPEVNKPQDTSLTLRSGFDPGVDKFISEDIKPAAIKAKEVASTVAGAIKDTTNFLTNVLDASRAVEKGFGGQAYADVIRAIHRGEAEEITFDNNFAQVEKWFNQFSEKDLQSFNYTRGTPGSTEGEVLQLRGLNSVPDALKDPTLVNVIKKASDHVYNLANDNGVPLNYFEDYFRGVYKATKGKTVQGFLDYWYSTDAFTKNKTFPTAADAAAYGLELKDANPITNIKSELKVVAQRVGLKQLVDKLAGPITTVDGKTQINLASSDFIRPAADVPQELVGTWKKVNDPTFNGLLADPKYTDFINNLLSTNKVSSNRFTAAIRQLTFIAQRVKFFGSAFHMVNMLKASVSEEAFGALDPRGYGDFAKGFTKIDTTDPLYKDYVNLGGGHKYSLESQAVDSRIYANAVDKFSRGNYLGGLTKTIADTISLPSNFVKWMFQDYIPKLKFEKFTQDVETQASKLGRPLTDAEKITIIKQNQNIYGEMNERLFGRSGTATSVARLAFTAPGYAEGNFRVIGNVLKANPEAAGFVIKSLMTTAIAATLTTRALSGKWPSAPKTLKDVRDLFKVKTNQKDGNGDTVYYDLMTYDNDYWSVFGNLATGQPGNIPGSVTSRFSGLVSSPTKAMTDLAAIIEGKNVVDYKNDPIYFRTDPLAVKIKKFITYEGLEAQPISTSNLGQSLTKGTGLLTAATGAFLGLRPTTSEQVKRIKAARSDLFSMQAELKNKRVELDKLVNENPQEAVRQAKAFNQAQMKKINNIYKTLGAKAQISKTELDRFYLIVNLHPTKAKTGTTPQSIVGQ